MDEREARAIRLEHNKAINRYHHGLIDRHDTIRTYLNLGASLIVCCRCCPRMIEWTPDDLRARFGDRLDFRIYDLATRLRCTGEDGCGSKDVAVFPLPADRPRPKA